jgi:hypothetical protein
VTFENICGIIVLALGVVVFVAAMAYEKAMKTTTYDDI